MMVNVSKEEPVVSIVIPTYNRATTIANTIESFLAQTFKDWELFVVDDYSEDNTKEVVELYHQLDSRISFITNERKKGAQGARNTGILHANSDWICLFDSDDFAYPDFLEQMTLYLYDQYDVITCYARQVNINDGTSNVVTWGGDGNIEKDLLIRTKYVGMDDCVYRKSKLFAIGLLDEDCPRFQEYDTHIRLSRCCVYKSVKCVLMDYTWGGNDSLSFDKQKNVVGLLYVLFHNKIRWKEVAYYVYRDVLMSNFRHVSLVQRFKIIKEEPKILCYIPKIYWEAIVRFIKRCHC